MAEAVENIVDRTQTLTLTCDVTDSAETQRCYSDTKSAILPSIRVLDLTRIVAGPYCTMILGDMGAEVIKVENPDGGDEARRWGPPFVDNSSDSCYFLALNRNKQSLCVDLKQKRGVELVKELAGKCDVLVENYVPGKLDKLGLGYSQVAEAASGIIYCSLTGFGLNGPYSSRPGYDVIVSSIGGLMHITGPQDGDPCKTGVPLVDMVTGLYAHGAILAALYQRTFTGKGQRIDCNLLSSQLSTLTFVASNYLNAGVKGTRWGSAHPSIVPYRSYQTADKKFLTIGTGSDKQFADLCNRLGLQMLIDDERFVTNKDRVANRKILDDLIQKKFNCKTIKEWDEVFIGATFPYGPVNSIKEALEDPHVRETKIVQEINHAKGSRVKLIGPAVSFSDGVNSIRTSPPCLGQHTDEVLSRVLGYSQTQIESLKDAKIPPVVLKLKKPKSDKKVQWTTETVDNEHMDKKKSKCCCIFKKPRSSLDSSSDDDDDLDCDNCRGHVEKKKKKEDPESSHGDGAIVAS